jgi:pyruvate dehydrogenase E2 component (dihydrolipoamide acetyltransferase)
MASEIVMPRLGWTMEKGTLVEWLKQDGDRVESGEILFTVETEKAVHEVESFDSGILRIPPESPAPGATVPVGTLLAYVLAPGEAVPFKGPAAPPVPAMDAPKPIPEPQPPRVPSNPVEGHVPAISPRARRVAAELGVAWRGLAGSGRTGRIVERDVRAAGSR